MTLNVNGTCANTAYAGGTTSISSGLIKANTVYEFVYDGTNWQLLPGLDTNFYHTPDYTSGLRIASNNGVAAIGHIYVPEATTTSYGVVKIGNGGGLAIDPEGFLVATGGSGSGSSNYTLPFATTESLGGIIVGENLSVTDGVLSVPDGSTTTAGVLKLGTTSDTAMAGNKTLTNVSYTSTTTNSNYPLLFKYYTSTTTTAAGTRFNTGIYANPSTVTVSATNGFYETSDERLKDFKGNVDVDLDKLALIPKKYFTWKDDSEKVLRIGTSAQELQKLYPELVSDTNGELTVDYAKLSVVALAAVDKLNTKVKSLEERLNKLENILSNLINS